MKPEINDYIIRNYYMLLGIAFKYTKNNDWASELLHEVVLQLYEKEHPKLKLDDNSIKYYIIRMLMVNWCYPSSPFYIKYKKHNHTHVDLKEAMMVINDETTDQHNFMDILEEEFSDTNWFNKIIFEKYILLGSLKKVSLDTKIPLTSIKRYVKETKTLIKFNVVKRFDNE
jgi:hypothetical protein